MKLDLYQLYVRHCFRPGIIGFFINPFYIVRSKIYHAVKAHAPEITGRVLDFGSGSKPYRHLFKTEEYIGLDVDQAGHTHEKEEVDVFYDGTIIPFESGHFDSCFSSQVFEHIFDLELSLQEIHRVVKPGGKCLFIVPFVWNEHEVPYDFGRYSSFGLAHLLKQTGFIVEKQEKDSHFLEVFAQLWCLYLYNAMHTRNRVINLLTSVVIIPPFTALGWIVKTILPRNNSLYFNSVIVATRGTAGETHPARS